MSSLVPRSHDATIQNAMCLLQRVSSPIPRHGWVRVQYRMQCVCHREFLAPYPGMVG